MTTTLSELKEALARTRKEALVDSPHGAWAEYGNGGWRAWKTWMLDTCDVLVDKLAEAEQQLKEKNDEGWHEAPLPEPILGGMLLVEFGFASCGPEDRDRYAFFFTYTRGVKYVWLMQGHEPETLHIVRWLWVRRGEKNAAAG